jgi:hypothetical protein
MPVVTGAISGHVAEELHWRLRGDVYPKGTCLDAGLEVPVPY